MTTINPTVNFPTVGMSPQALVGADLDVYFYNSRWVAPIKKYLEADHILPTVVRLNELPGNALIVKSSSGWYRRVSSIKNNQCALPSHYQLFFTSGPSPSTTAQGRHTRFNRNYTWCNPRITQYLSFETKELWNKYDRVHYSGFATKLAEPVFKDTDPQDMLIPRLSFTSCPEFSIEDLQSMSLGVQYLLKLFQVAFNLQYDEATSKWVD